MITQKAAERILKLFEGSVTLDQNAPKQDTRGKTLAHAFWMLEGIASGYISGRKSHRWLGYAQALLVTHDAQALHQCKAINKESTLYRESETSQEVSTAHAEPFPPQFPTTGQSE